MELQEQVEFLNHQIKNNQESEYMISELNGQISKIRTQLTRNNELIQLKSNDMIGLKRQLQHNTNVLQQMRQKNHKASIEREMKAREIEKLKQIVEELTNKINKIADEKDNANYRLRHLDELFCDEEKAIQLITLESSRLSQMLHRSSQILQQQHDEQKLLEVGRIMTLMQSILKLIIS